jgi:hypothetical protein
MIHRRKAFPFRPDDDHPDPGVGVELGEVTDHAGKKGRIHGVALFGPVEYQPANVAVFFHFEGIFAHDDLSDLTIE